MASDQREIAIRSPRTSPQHDSWHPVHLRTGYEPDLRLYQTACGEGFTGTGRPWLAHTQKPSEVTCKSCLRFILKLREELRIQAPRTSAPARGRPGSDTPPSTPGSPD